MSLRDGFWLDFFLIGYAIENCRILLFYAKVYQKFVLIFKIRINSIIFQKDKATKSLFVRDLQDIPISIGRQDIST